MIVHLVHFICSGPIHIFFLQVMIYLIDHVLPESYFANNLRALSVDMAVFRELLHIQLPLLSRHLDRLQVAARDHNTGRFTAPACWAFRHGLRLLLLSSKLATGNSI